ncbi:hypothetical protein MMC34_002492 [Xylographa carneopallida]|nr:hypothetical protein [Xylographa carneopallida]
MKRRTTAMTSTFSSLLRKGTDLLTPGAPSAPLVAPTHEHGFTTAPAGALFPQVDPAVDGPDCALDCASCTVHYPAKFSIDEEEKLYGMVKGWATHMLVATGKTDWVRDVQDEKGSVMEAVGRWKGEPANGRLMLSASNMPVPAAHHGDYAKGAEPTTVLLLPAFTLVDNVTPQAVPDLIEHYISTSSTNTTPLIRPAPALPPDASPQPAHTAPTSSQPSIPAALPPSLFPTRPSPHSCLILLCSQKTRDARCGQSAPLLRRELERHLRSLGLYRDLHDERPGGVGIYFISHVGGHKFSANMMVYRRAGVGVDGKGKVADGEAGQCIWLARVRPEDCEGIVKFTVLQGKVVKPERQLRGGFDRERGVVSW